MPLQCPSTIKKSRWDLDTWGGTTGYSLLQLWKDKRISQLWFSGEGHWDLGWEED